MFLKNFPKKSFYLILLLLVFLFILGFEIIQVSQDIRFLERKNVSQPLPNSQFYLHLRRTPPQPNMIAPWMTFHYIEKVFLLPQNYLKNQLHIADSRYPRLSLSAYARAQNLSSVTLLDEVRLAVSAYQKMSTSTTATSTPR